MTTPINCPVFATDRKKKPIRGNLRTRIEARAEDTRRILQHAAQHPRQLANSATEQFLQQQARQTWIMTIGDLIHLNPRQLPGLQDLVTAQFGYLQRAFGLDPSIKYSTPGEIRNSLIRAKSSAEGLINAAGRIVALGEMQRFMNRYRTITNRLGIKRQIADELLLDITEVGQSSARRSALIHYSHDVLGRQSMFDVIERRRYQDMYNRLTREGFSKQEIDELITDVVHISDSFDRVRAIARMAGVEIGDQSNIGYLPRIFSEDFKLRYADIEADELLNTIDTSITEFSSVFNRSRNTYHFIPEDLAIVADVLQIKPSDIMTMMSDMRVWRQYLHNNLSVGQLDYLVDSGVMQKMPMTSREIFEYFVDQYEMPYKWMNEMMLVDPEAMMSEYAASLQRSAGNSAMFRRMIEGEAITRGWAITRSMQQANPELYGNFIPLGDQMNRWAMQARIVPQQVVPTPELIGRAIGTKPEIIRQASDILVHPQVAHQWGALMEISVDPHMMGTVGRTMYYMSRFFNKQVLTNTRYVLNTLLQSVAGSFAAGANLLLMLPSMMHTMKVMTHGLEYFDRFPNVKYKVRADGTEMTLRQVYEYFLITTGHNMAPGSNMVRIGDMASRRRMIEGIMGAPESMQRAVHQILSYSAAAGSPTSGVRIPGVSHTARFSRRVGVELDKLTNAAFAPFAFTANFFDIATKWAALLSFLENTNGGRFAADKVGQFFSSGQLRTYDDIDDAIRHINEYFYNPYNIGRTTSFVNNYIRPFAAWSMANPPMQIRHMMRNPHTYVAVHRLRSYWNTPLYTEEEYNEDNVSNWILKADPLYLGRDENGNPIVSITNSWDAGYDFLQWADQSGRDFRRAWFGAQEGTMSEIRQLNRSRSETFEQWLLETLGETNVVWRTLVETVTGKQTFPAGESIGPQDDLDVRPTLWGMALPPRLINVLRKFPMVEAIDQINPGGVFGESQVIDTSGRIVREGRPSPLTGNDRTRVVGRSLDDLGGNLPLRLARLVGVNVRTIDYGRGAQTTLDDIEYTERMLQESIMESRILLESSPNMSERERQRILEERERKILLLGQIRIDHARVLQWARDNDVVPRDALRELNNLRIRVRSLPDPNAETLDDIYRRTFTENGIPYPP